MKCGIVSLSTLNKYDRWDAGFYLGEAKIEKEDLVRSQERLKEQRVVVQRRKALLATELKRIQGLVQNSEVKEIR